VSEERDIEIEVTPEMIEAAYAVWRRYGVRDCLEVDSDIMRETIAAACSAGRKRRS
jgi:predicted O-methyltransferase YrrM